MTLSPKLLELCHALDGPVSVGAFSVTGGLRRRGRIVGRERVHGRRFRAAVVNPLDQAKFFQARDATAEPAGDRAAGRRQFGAGPWAADQCAQYRIALAPVRERRTNTNPVGGEGVANMMARVDRAAVVRVALAAGTPLPPFHPAKPVSAALALNPRPWLTRGEKECHWPITQDDGEVWSCCNTVAAGSRYCPDHKLIAFTPAPGPVKALRYDGTARMRA